MLSSFLSVAVYRCWESVCVCVCVTYVYSTFNLLHIIYDAGELRLPYSFDLPAIRQLRSLPCYTPTTFPNPFRVLDFSSSRPYLLYPVYLTSPGREQCHHRPIRQLKLLPDAHPFVARAVEEQAVRTHYR